MNTTNPLMNPESFVKRLNNAIELAAEEHSQRLYVCTVLAKQINFDNMTTAREELLQKTVDGLSKMSLNIKDTSTCNGALVAKLYYAIKDLKKTEIQKPIELDSIFNTYPFLRTEFEPWLKLTDLMIFNNLMNLVIVDCEKATHNPLVILLTDLILITILLNKYHETRNPNQQ